ncbi:uncharacterized protein LOC144628296 isoform X2 [Oculina patagonica]
MGEFGETRKGQNLETIISKLSKEQPNGKRNSFMLISGIDHSNVMFHLGTGGHESEGEDSEPDLFQCGKCKRMFTSLQKYLKHKAAKDCAQLQAGQRSTISPVTNGEVFDSPDENSSIHSPTRRKHDRKGIARRVSNFSSEGESVSPDIPVVVPEQVYSVHPPSFPVHIEAPSASNYHDFSNPVVSISVAEALRSHSPVVVQPTPNFSMWNGSVNEQAENVNPPTMATSVYAQMPSTSVVNAMPVLPLQHPSQPTSAPSISSSHMDQQWTGPRMRGIPVEIQPVAPQAPVHMTRSRPVRAKETGLTEEELTDEIVTSSGQKVYRCKKCDKEFSFSSRLKRHLLVHTGARPFECHVCHRRFTQAVDLKRHMLRHSGQKPHVCHFCGKQYTRGDRLKVHLLSHTQEDNSEKPYSCSRCSATFYEAEELRLHVCEFQDGAQPGTAEVDLNETAAYVDNSGAKLQRGGKNYTCDECNSSFTKYTSLKSHLLKHTGEKKYKCEHCNKTFFSSSSLKIHVRVHTGDRPFKCKECPRKFSDPSNFNKHKRWHAKQKGSATVAATATLSSISENSSSSDDKVKERATAEQSSSGQGEQAEEQIGTAEGSPKDELREDLFPGTSQDMETEDPGGFKSPGALLNMAAETETNVKQEVTE